MTKLPKTSELTGKVEDIFPNLIMVADKNIAVPIDKKDKMTGVIIGDMVKIIYDDRGYLQELTVVEKTKAPGKKSESAPMKTDEQHHQEVKRVLGDPEKKDRLIEINVLLKAWTELYIHSMNPEQIDFNEGRRLIIEAVREDLGVIPSLGGEQK